MKRVIFTWNNRTNTQKKVWKQSELCTGDFPLLHTPAMLQRSFTGLGFLVLIDCSFSSICFCFVEFQTYGSLFVVVSKKIATNLTNNPFHADGEPR